MSSASGAQPIARRCRPSTAATYIRRRRLLARAHPAHPLSARLAAVRPARSSLRPRRPAHARPVAQRIGARGAGARCARPWPRVQQRGRRHASRPDAASASMACRRTERCAQLARQAFRRPAPPPARLPSSPQPPPHPTPNPNHRSCSARDRPPPPPPPPPSPSARSPPPSGPPDPPSRPAAPTLPPPPTPPYASSANPRSWSAPPPFLVAGPPPS